MNANHKEDTMFNDPQTCWDSESRESPFSTVADPNEDDYCEGCDGFVTYTDAAPNGTCRCDENSIAHTCDEIGPWGCNHPDCVAAAAAEQNAEIDAENAWLRAAEAPTAADYAFEMWEAQRCAFDPQGGYSV